MYKWISLQSTGISHLKKVKNYNNQLKNKQQWQQTYLRLQTRKVQKYSGVTNATKQKHETNSLRSLDDLKPCFHMRFLWNVLQKSDQVLDVKTLHFTKYFDESSSGKLCK